MRRARRSARGCLRGDGLGLRWGRDVGDGNWRRNGTLSGAPRGAVVARDTGLRGASLRVNASPTRVTTAATPLRGHEKTLARAWAKVHVASKSCVDAAAAEPQRKWVARSLPALAGMDPSKGVESSTEAPPRGPMEALGARVAENSCGSRHPVPGCLHSKAHPRPKTMRHRAATRARRSTQNTRPLRARSWPVRDCLCWSWLRAPWFIPRDAGSALGRTPDTSRPNLH